MRPSVPWVNFILYGGLALLAFTAAVWASCYEQPIGAFVSVWAAAAGFLAVFVVVFVGWFVRFPTFIARGVSVWDGDIRFITETAVVDALKFYVERLPTLLEEQHMAEKHVVTSDALWTMLFTAQIEWTDKPITLISRFWQIRDANGLQQGKSIMVRWTGSISGSALFHELHHMVDEIVLKRSPDHKHENKHWWALVPMLKRESEI
ncbi:MAG: hypothetical protein DRJ03_01980 [Chloroflexi bacterium]|nr:MAG: hypothetical protein DRJ03_01980 [Chloroflexota bacterium]